MIALITLTIGLVPGILKSIPGIPANIQQLIADVSGAVAAVLGSGVATQPSLNTLLLAWVGVITALKNDPNLPANSLSAVAELEKIVQVTLTQDAQLAKSVDWTKFQPITPVA